MSEKKWYAVYTRVRWEKKVSELLSKKHIENYCPLNKVKKQWADRKKIVLEPLFTSYVFVRISPDQHLQMIKTDGVINFVHWLGKPAQIRDIEIAMIRSFLGEHTHVTLEKTSVNLHDIVRVVSGPLMKHEGQVIAVKSNTVKIVLPSLGYMMSAEIQTSRVEVVRTRILFELYGQDNLALG
ncbi:UpxY family transcription antiterminator [Flavitalea sp.]|nr:UpxY family transcription antiterminator [Flavitalea sp.]